MNLKLNYEGYEEYFYLKREIYDGVQYFFKKNGKGLSVIKHSGSYGSSADLWEIVEIIFYGDGSWAINGKPEGYYSDEAVKEVFEDIFNTRDIDSTRHAVAVPIVTPFKRKISNKVKYPDAFLNIVTGYSDGYCYAYICLKDTDFSHIELGVFKTIKECEKAFEKWKNSEVEEDDEH